MQVIESSYCGQMLLILMLLHALFTGNSLMYEWIYIQMEHWLNNKICLPHCGISVQYTVLFLCHGPSWDCLNRSSCVVSMTIKQQWYRSSEWFSVEQHWVFFVCVCVCVCGVCVCVCGVCVIYEKDGYWQGVKMLYAVRSSMRDIWAVNKTCWQF